MASRVAVSSPLFSCSESRVKLKIETLILLKFNMTGLDLRSLETEYRTYFHEKLDMKGYSSTRDLIETMKPEIEISDVDGNSIIKAASLSKERTVKVLAKIFPSESKPSVPNENRDCSSGPPVLSHELSSGSRMSLSDPSKTRGFAQNININEKDYLDRGGFGKVYRGNWDGTEVAVKIFYSRIDVNATIKYFSLETFDS